MAIQAIETSYGGCRFRSRLEARWAAMFDQLGWYWTYEPFDTGRYIPDFLIHGAWPFVIEVKPAVRKQDYEAVADHLDATLAGSWRGDVAILGVDPIAPSAWNGENWDHPTAGYLGEDMARYSDENGEEPASWDWDAGLWVTCGKCGQPAIIHSLQAYACRPCGHWDGDHYVASIDRRQLQGYWNVAHTRTRWIPGTT